MALQKRTNNLPVQVQVEENLEENFEINEIFVTNRQVIATFSQLHSGQMGDALSGIIAQAAEGDESLADITFDQLILDGKDPHNDGHAYWTAIFNRPELQPEIAYEYLGTEEAQELKPKARSRKKPEQQKPEQQEPEQ